VSNSFEIQQVAVIGAGTMGRGIVVSLASAGLSVLWLESNAATLDAGLTMIQQTWAQQVDKQRITQAQADDNLRRVRAVADYASLADADIAIEAVYENLEIKQAIFRELDAHLKPQAILASNTSALDIDSIAAVTGRASQVLGLHFFSPAHIMKLLEIVRGKHTQSAVLQVAQALGQRIGKVAVIAGNCPGFIGNRMLRSYVAEACMTWSASIWSGAPVNWPVRAWRHPWCKSTMLCVSSVAWDRRPARVTTDTLPEVARRSMIRRSMRLCSRFPRAWAIAAAS
jgi:3-hydroxyacyl-CoA dehydrogenase